MPKLERTRRKGQYAAHESRQHGEIKGSASYEPFAVFGFQKTQP
jgi:hypothetical protein